MNNISINLLNALSIQWGNAYFMLLLIPGVILALFPFFRLKKEKRYTRNRVVSMFIHILILLLSVLVLSGFTIIEDNALKKNETIILLDVSDSTLASRQQMTDYVSDVIQDVDASNKVGIVAFGDNEPMKYQPLRTGTSFNVNDFNNKTATDNCDLGSATKLQDALNYSLKMLTSKKGSKNVISSGARIIVLTDGVETDGSAEDWARTYAGKIKIDAVYFEPTTFERELQISAVDMKHSILAGESVDVTVTIDSHIDTNAKIKIFDIPLGGEQPDTPIATQDVPVIKGNQQFVVSVANIPSTPKIHTIKVELECGDDTLAANNEFFSYVTIASTHKILIIEGKGQNTNATYLKNLLSTGDTKYDVDQFTEANAPINLNDYGEIILMNVNIANLSQGYANRIEKFVRDGGGLLTTGGEDTYYYGNMKTTSLNYVLPVDVVPDPSEGKAVYILVDASSSMFADGPQNLGPNHNQQRMDLTKEALRNSVASGAFKDGDYFGLIYFGGKKPPVKALGLTAVETGRMKMFTAINSIEKMANTEWSLSLKMAYQELSTFDASTKHVIFITDGEPNSKIAGVGNEAWKGLAADAYKRFEITTSCIVVGADSQGLIDYSRQLSTEGHGNFRASDNTQDITAQLDEECKSIKTDIVAEESTYYPTIQGINPVLKGLDSYLPAGEKDITKLTLPTIKRYNGSTARSKATVVIENAKDGLSDPIYAQWTYPNGSGKVGSFMTDVGSSTAWGGGYLGDNGLGDMLFKNIAGALFSSNASTVSSGTDITYANKNYTTTATISLASDEETEVVSVIDAYIYSPEDDWTNNKTEQLATFNMAESSYTGDFIANKQGLYKISYAKWDADGKVLEEFYDYMTFSYSSEYNTFFDGDKAFRLVSSMCSISGGQLFDPSEDIFSHDLMYTTEEHNPQLGFMIAALLLFVLDIIVRKFNFKWPHEFFRPKDEARA